MGDGEKKDYPLVVLKVLVLKHKKEKIIELERIEGCTFAFR